MKFRTFLETTDIFGFDKEHAPKDYDDKMLSKPIHQFDVELMMSLLARKRVGLYEARVPFMNEIRWGSEPGAVKLDVDTGMRFYVKRLNMDKEGSPTWVTKKLFQLNRQGYGGTEDMVAQEIFEHLQNATEAALDSPQEGYSEDDLKDLVIFTYNKVKRICKDIFIPVGIKKISEGAYVFCMEVRGHGVQRPDYKRVEQNQTLFTYDESRGTIRVTNYNIESRVGGAHEWYLQPIDLDLYFFPNQDRDEISECLAVRFKYY